MMEDSGFQTGQLTETEITSSFVTEVDCLFSAFVMEQKTADMMAEMDEQSL